MPGPRMPINHGLRRVGAILWTTLAFAIGTSLSAEDVATVLNVQDFAVLPVTGRTDGTGQVDGLLARVNGLTEEPGGADRYFVHDLNGPLYILDKATKRWSTYLDFNGRD